MKHILSKRCVHFLHPYLKSQRNWMATFNNSRASRKGSGQKDRRAKFHLSVQIQLSHKSAIAEIYFTCKCARLYNARLRFSKVCAPMECPLLHELLLFLFVSCITYLLLWNKWSRNFEASISPRISTSQASRCSLTTPSGWGYQLGLWSHLKAQPKRICV